MSSLVQELAKVAGQAKALVLADVTQASGQGALTPVQSPTQLWPIRPEHLALQDIKAFEPQEGACNTYEQAFNAYTAISKETINIASQRANALGVMNDRFRASTDALTSRRQENSL